MRKGFKKGIKNTLRECYIENHICHIPLNNGQESLCDEDRFDEVNKYSWYANDSGYALAYILDNGKCNYKRVRLHKLLYPEFKYIDHINLNKLDNRGCNLRECTHQQNCMNQKVRSTCISGYKGVKLDKRWNKYNARIRFNGKEIYLGQFSDPKDAARAYNKAAIEYFGEFAQLNIIEE